MKTPLHPAYREAVFDFDPAGKPGDFWVITACNPDGRTVDPAENRAADERLRRELAARGFETFRVTGMSADASHAEPGWGIPCDEAKALEIGRHYRQEAVFHFHGGRIDLVDCRDGSREDVDEIRNRMRGPGE